MQVGDKVQYIPAKCHALNRDIKGDYPWVLGQRRFKRVGGKQIEEIEELKDKRIGEYLTYLSRHPNPDKERENLVFIRPRETWPSVITAINEDDTVDLDVQSNQGGFTLHLKGIRVSDSTTDPNTCVESN